MEDAKKVEGPIDAVFVIGTGSKNGNEELRYALRCLDKRCPFVRDVYISGECPEWVDTSVVKHIKWPDRFSHAKDANIIDKLRRACEQEGIAKSVLFCSDDQFVTRVCSWEDFSPMWLRRYSPDDKWYENKKRVWHTRLRKTLQREYDRRVAESIPTDGVCYFQPHMWMQIDRDKFVEYAKWSEYERRDDTIIASGYFNFAGERGKENNDHVFLSSNHHGGIGVTHVAYTDSSFGAAMEYLKAEFPEMSRYERVFEKDEKAGKEEPQKQEKYGKSDKSDKSERNSIEKFVDALGKRAIWSPLVEQVRIVEGMRNDSLPGWREILNDLIVRWAATTAKGEKVVPVDLKERDPMITLATTSYASGAARVFLEKVGKKIEANHANRSNVANSLPQAVKAAEETIQKQTSNVTTKTAIIQAKSTPRSSEPTVTRTVEVKKCSKCEEKRRKRMEEEKARKDKEAKEANEVKDAVSAQIVVNRVFGGLQPVSPATTPQETAVAVDEVDDGAWCVECVLEHLGVAAAYLGSNGGYPTLAETALAKGEFTVATRLILALKREALYNRCVDVMASWSTDESLLSAGEVSSILREAANLA